jgi:hypothetical protein
VVWNIIDGAKTGLHSDFGNIVTIFFIFIFPYPFFIAVYCFLFAVYVIIDSPFFFVHCFIYHDLFCCLSLFKLPRSKWRGRRERLMFFYLVSTLFIIVDFRNGKRGRGEEGYAGHGMGGVREQGEYIYGTECSVKRS